jgi:hypothetical protein
VSFLSSIEHGVILVKIQCGVLSELFSFPKQERGAETNTVGNKQRLPIGFNKLFWLNKDLVASMVCVLGYSFLLTRDLVIGTDCFS